ncbi:hypothetical protein CCACVL1_03178 [Corchorus capsularis]|uniref:Uncharacterized protein n=1 Tax=Corchorus capsularis TaxID=210143 RepID=A0A1R3K1T9_COCAP|nr:hypothetical protein CCACVL1_03178 [Corchorus capsularis]
MVTVISHPEQTIIGLGSTLHSFGKRNSHGGSGFLVFSAIGDFCIRRNYTGAAPS